MLGAALIIIDCFLFVYLMEHLYASASLCGMTVGVTVLFELPIFHYFPQLLKYAGHDILLLFSMTSFAIRSYGYAILTPKSVNWILPFESLHGISFACVLIASVDYCGLYLLPKDGHPHSSLSLRVLFTTLVVGLVQLLRNL